jgi:HAD superfamily hydrolase (TIGR01458 family)
MRVRGLLLDVEGVLVTDKRFIAAPAAAEFMRQVRAANCPLRLITNNTTDDRRTILDKLAHAGLTFADDELHTCTNAAMQHLHGLKARRCLVLGNLALRRIFLAGDFEVVDDADVDAVVVGLDTDLTWQRLQHAVEAVLVRRAAFVALHQNRLYDDNAGRTAPSVGAIAAAIEYATQITPTVIGKPNPAFFNQALADLRLPPDQVLVISDDPFSDLVGARRLGLHTALVLSGKYRERAVLERVPTSDHPELVVSNLGELLDGGTVQLT